MLLSSPHHSAEKFSHPIASSGLRSLLAPPSGGIVVTRAIAAASRGYGAGEGGVQESRDGATIDHEEEKSEQEEDEAEEDVIRSDEEDEGCWVSYGRREPRRRLPPPIPSQLARGALRRTRTRDGRLVIRVPPAAVWRQCICARRRRGGRLTLQLVEHHHHDDDSPSTPRSARQYDAGALEEPPDDDDTSSPTVAGEGVDDDTAAPVPAIGLEGVEEEPAAAQGVLLPVVHPPRVPSAGCFEDVFKYGSIGGSSLHHQIMPSLRMVH